MVFPIFYRIIITDPRLVKVDPDQLDIFVVLIHF